MSLAIQAVFISPANVMTPSILSRSRFKAREVIILPLSFPWMLNSHVCCISSRCFSSRDRTVAGFRCVDSVWEIERNDSRYEVDEMFNRGWCR